MGKPRNPYRFTRKETIARLQAAKSYLGNKERLAFMQALSISLPPGYRSEDDESFYAAPRLSKFDIQCLVDCTEVHCNYDWRRDVRFKPLDAVQFTELKFRQGASIGESVVIIFYPWKDQEKVSKVATLWLGTWHHAPLVAWSDGSEIKIEFLPEYIDLIH